MSTFIFILGLVAFMFAAAFAVAAFIKSGQGERDE